MYIARVPMKTKLTLSIDPQALGAVKSHARSKGVSVSALFEEWSSRITAEAHAVSLGVRLRGQWQEGVDSSDPRLEFLLSKHSR